MLQTKPIPDLLSLKGILSNKSIKGKNIDQIIKEEKEAIAEAFTKRNRPDKKSTSSFF